MEGGGIGLTEAQSWLLLGETEESYIKQQDNKCSGKVLYQVPPAHNSSVMLLKITCLVNHQFYIITVGIALHAKHSMILSGLTVMTLATLVAVSDKWDRLYVILNYKVEK